MKLLVIGALAGTLSLGIASYAPAAQSRLAASSLDGSEAVPTQAMTLATVHIPRTVKANDQMLAPGTYTVQLMGEPLKPAVGETPNLEQWVEFLQAGKVRGKAVASIVPADQILQVEREPVPASGQARIDILKGNEYLRVWINRNGNNYLIHLPTATS